MMVYVACALLAGILVGLSRQINGRLSLSTSALVGLFRRTRWRSLYRYWQLADRPDRGGTNGIVDYRRSDDFRCRTGYRLGERRQFHSTYTRNRIDHWRNVGRSTQEYSSVKRLFNTNRLMGFIT